MDVELSPLVQRSFSLRRAQSPLDNESDMYLDEHEGWTMLYTEYKAATNRMLRVAANGFMESLALLLEIAEQLDVDILAAQPSAKCAQS